MAFERSHPTRRQIAEEDLRLSKIQRIVDSACAALELGVVTERGADELIAHTKRRVLELAPDHERQYDLIYAPRLQRSRALSFGQRVNIQEIHRQ